MSNTRIKICYNGSGFNGWQRQRTTANTIQQHLEEIIENVLGEPVKLIASGRTDAGVHALGQVANFRSNKDISDYDEFVREVNLQTSDNVKIVEAQKVANDFHSRLSAVQKTYGYRICLLDKTRVFDRDRMYPYGQTLDIDSMRLAAKSLCGEHDFRAFSSEKNKDKSTVRNIKNISIEENNGMLNILFTGNGFLYNMVRILTGTLIEVGNGKKKVEDIEQALISKKRMDAGFMAPACGLTLIDVYYN